MVQKVKNTNYLYHYFLTIALKSMISLTVVFLTMAFFERYKIKKNQKFANLKILQYIFTDKSMNKFPEMLFQVVQKLWQDQHQSCEPKQQIQFIKNRGCNRTWRSTKQSSTPPPVTKSRS